MVFVPNRFVTVAAGCVAALLTSTHALAAESGALRAGAARVEITPEATALPPPYTTILDPLFVRAIVLDNGHTRAALINADVGMIGDPTWERVSTQVAQELDIPVENILISATHDHSAPIFGGGPFGGNPNPKAAAFGDKVESGMIEAVRKARASLQPARIGFGTGRLYLNVNRDAIDPKTRLWAQEPNLAYPSDKTLAVIKIESHSGDLIAVYMNYAMHANSLFLSGEVSGDFPGAAARYLEREYGDEAVAMWTSGAAGDQNPLYLRAMREISRVKVNAVMESQNLDEGPAIMRAMFVGDPAAEKAAVDPIVLEHGHQMVASMGQLTAEETIRLMGAIASTSSDVDIVGAQTILSCPGRRRLDNARQGTPGQYEDSPDPVRIRIGSLRIGDIALGTANAELYNMIGQRVKQESKYHNTIMVTLTNGAANSGYVPTDDAFGRYTFQVLGSRLKPGCAEEGIVHGVNALLEQTSR